MHVAAVPKKADHDADGGELSAANQLYFSDAAYRWHQAEGVVSKR